MDEPMEQFDEPEDDPAKASVIKKVALPASVIFMSWFCGIIACGATCSFAQSPVHMLLLASSGKVRYAAWVWWALAIALGVYVGLRVAKDVRRRYDVDQRRKDRQ